MTTVTKKLSLWLLLSLLALLDEAPRHDAELLAVYQGFPAQTTKSFAAFLYYESFGKGRKENDNAKAVSFRTEKSRKRTEETTRHILRQVQVATSESCIQQGRNIFKFLSPLLA